MDLSYTDGDWLIRGEAFGYNFIDGLSESNQAKGFWGGYAETGYFVSGDKQHGFQLIGRYERAGYVNKIKELTGPLSIQSFLLGYNWYRHGIFRLQSNIIYELADKRSKLEQVTQTGKKDGLLIMSMLQIKF